MKTFIVSAARPDLGSWTEIHSSRQKVTDEAKAARLVAGRNHHEHKAGSVLRWGYYEEQTTEATPKP